MQILKMWDWLSEGGMEAVQILLLMAGRLPNLMDKLRDFLL